MYKRILQVGTVLIALLAILLLHSCTTAKSGEQAITFLNDNRENYPDAAQRNLEQLKQPWHIKQVHQGWDEICFVRLFDYRGTDYLVYAQGDRKYGFSLEVKSLKKNENSIHFIASDLKFKWSTLDNFRQIDDKVYFYTEDLCAYYFSLDSFNLVTAEAYPFEQVDYVNAIVSPDKKKQVYWFNNTIYIKDLETGTNEILWDDPDYDGMWSIGDITWSTDSKKLFFDNTGGAACIWELSIEKNTLNKIVPDHNAIHPFSFSRNGYDYVLYSQETSIRMATNDPGAEGFLDPASIDGDTYYLPLEVKEPGSEDYPLMLELMPFKSVGQVLFQEGSSEYEDYTFQTTIWKVGTIMSDPYQAGILYRAENAEWYKGGSDYNVARYIKYQDKVIVLPQSSSIYDDYLKEQDVFARNLSDPLITSEVFAGCEHVVLDYQVAVEGIYIPELLLDVSGYFRVKFREEILIDPDNENPDFRVTDLNNLQNQLELAFEDELVGEVYIEKREETEEQHPFFKSKTGGLFVFTGDESVLCYRLEPAFTGSIPLDPQIDMEQYAGCSDYGYINEGGGELDYALWYTEKEFFQTEMHVLGTNSYGDTLWGNMETEHPLIQLEYERIKSAGDIFQYVDTEAPETYDEFLQLVPMFFWKDPFGRYIRFISIDYMTPLMAEPIIYLYDEKMVEYTISLDKKVEVVSSIPEIKSGWQVYGSGSGDLRLICSGRQYEYLFWEGFAGFIPRLKTGFVVGRDDVPAFFDEKLSGLGLIAKEIEDFKKVWMPEFEKAPYYRISFYDQQIIDEIAPLTIDPLPETIIRVLMDYKPLAAPIDIVEPDLGETPARYGTTLVEWGGLKR